jgi:hypothetical protein
MAVDIIDLPLGIEALAPHLMLASLTANRSRRMLEYIRKALRLLPRETSSTTEDIPQSLLNATKRPRCLARRHTPGPVSESAFIKGRGGVSPPILDGLDSVRPWFLDSG